MEVIHLVLGRANPNRMNGVNNVVYQLASRQALAGQEVILWGITPDLRHNYGERPFSTRLFLAQKMPFQLDFELRQALTEKKGKAIFHLHGGWIPVFSAISAILTTQQIPFVFTPHGAYNIIAMRRNQWVKKIYFQLFEKKLLARARKIHCIGQSEVSGLQCIFSTEKTFLLPYGFENQADTQHAISQKDDFFIIGFVGRLDIYTKGLDLMLEAFANLIQREKEAQLWIVGDGKQRSVLNRMITTRGLQGRVVLWGSQFGADKEKLMHKMSLFIHPSRNEGLPSSVLEASAMGIPCLVTEATNLAEPITSYRSGLAVANESASALTDALISLKKQWNKDRLMDMGKNARLMVEEAFSWSSILSNLDKLYQS